VGARKNRPGKFGTDNTSVPNARLRKLNRSAEVRALVDKIVVWERANPGIEHYIGWPDMDAAERLARDGYLHESPRATGCFHVTSTFRQVFMQSTQEIVPSFGWQWRTSPKAPKHPKLTRNRCR